MAIQHSCPKFDGCSAPICPLDKDWESRVYLDGEPTCPFLREWIKPGVRDRLLGAIDPVLASALSKAYPKMMEGYGPHQKRLKRSAKTPSRMFRGVAHG